VSVGRRAVSGPPRTAVGRGARLLVLLLAVTLAAAGLVLVSAEKTGAWDGNGSAEAAWAELQVGLKSWHAPGGGRQQSYTDRGWCGKFVAHAYGAKRVGFYDARALRAAAADAGTLRSGPVTSAPLGALVFYDLSEHGHVGIHVGGGYIVHAGYAERVRRDYWDWLDAYVGWSYPPPQKWPGRSSISTEE
jgi:hypothetical protein